MRSLPLLLLLLPTLAFAQGEEKPITKLPKVKKNVEAIYPAPALRDRVEATVVLELDIDADGYVSAADVVSSSTTAETVTSSTGVVSVLPSRSSTIANYGFDQAATVAGSRLEFEPAEAEGEKVPVRIQYTFRFKLPPPPPPPPPTIAGTDAPPPPDRPKVMNFTGVMRARGTRSLVPGVVVTIFRESEDGQTEGYEAVSGDDGVFNFYDLQPGEWKILAETDGYFPFRTTEEVTAGQVTEVTYFIEKGTYNPYDVLVEAERVKKEVNRRTLEIKEITKIAGTLGDPIQVVENLPGVARSQQGSGQIIVRGSGPNDTGVFINGVDIPLIYHFGGLRSVIPADVIESIDFFPGNYSVYYGRKTGGIFDAKIKRLKPDAVHGSLDVSLLDTSLYLEVPIGENAAIAIAGRRSYIDLVLKAVLPEDGNVSLTSAPVYYDFQVLANWRPAPSHDLQLTVLGSDDIIELLFENPASFSTQSRSGNLNAGTNFFRAIAEYRYTPSSEFNNQLSFSAGQDNINFTFGDQFRFLLQNNQLQLRERAEWKFADAFALAGGIDGLMRIADVEVLLPRPPSEGQGGQNVGNPDIDDVLFTKVEGQRNFLVAPYVEATIVPFEGLTLVPGLRLDYWELLDEVSLDPRLVARYQLLPEWTVKGGIGLVHQDGEPQSADPIFGNPDIGLQRAIHYSVGAEWTPEPYLKFDVVLFYKALDNLVSPTNATVVRDGKTVPLNVDNGGRGTVYGMELFLEHKFNNNLRGWLTYTLSRASRIDSGESDPRLFDFDQTHILAVVASYVFPENWEFGIRWRIVSGNPTTPFLTRPDVSPVVNTDLGTYVPIVGAVNSDRLPLFHQLDVRVDKTWIFDAWKFAAYLSLVNAYNRTNVEGFTFEFDYTRRNPQQGLPIYPILGVRGDF